MNGKRKYQIALIALAVIFVLVGWLGAEYEYLVLILFYFPTHWLVYKILKVE